jgi:hypothetical protein
MKTIEEEFNTFIKKWCGNSYPYLIDSDENDGERFREKLRNTTDKTVLRQKLNQIKSFICGVQWSQEDWSEWLKELGLEEE